MKYENNIRNLLRTTKEKNCKDRFSLNSFSEIIDLIFCIIGSHINHGAKYGETVFFSVFRDVEQRVWPIWPWYFIFPTFKAGENFRIKNFEILTFFGSPVVPHVLKNDRFAAFYGETFFFFSGSKFREKGEKWHFLPFSNSRSMKFLQMIYT